MGAIGLGRLASLSTRLMLGVLDSQRDVDDTREALRLYADVLERDQWKPIEDAPKAIISEFDGHRYGRYLLAYPVNGEVARVRWWESTKTGKLSSNFLSDGGHAVFPKVFRDLPEPPGAAV